MSGLDKLIHEPARLQILSILSGVGVADFNFLCSTLSLTKGNLSSHMDKLEKAGFVVVKKTTVGKVSHTEFSITALGREALAEYWENLDAIRNIQVDDVQTSTPPVAEE